MSSGSVCGSIPRYKKRAGIANTTPESSSVSSCEGCLSRRSRLSRHMSPTPLVEKPSKLCGNASFYFFCCPVRIYTRHALNFSRRDSVDTRYTITVSWSTVSRIFSKILENKLKTIKPNIFPKKLVRRFPRNGDFFWCPRFRLSTLSVKQFASTLSVKGSGAVS